MRAASTGNRRGNSSSSSRMKPTSSVVTRSAGGRAEASFQTGGLVYYRRPREPRGRFPRPTKDRPIFPADGTAMSTFRSTGVLCYSPTLKGSLARRDGGTTKWWLILDCDPDLGRYFRHLFHIAA